ncbi:MAG: hypothetical protein BXU00_03370 [Candidatus Nanoclepta minutus]|uniref:Uncharacterized protein n=1 Tax=Candidatus Nanoclepta minutus TaxID=1940235 RepID=A0A397WNE2_9ARCH|nr:MAG: hypothetical protein BXU00_03370 [Candidatus Nanoclepta minutus]
MDALQPLWDLFLPVIPQNYKIIAQSWGLYGPAGGILAFLAAVALIFGLFWLGMLLAFGKIIEGNPYAHRALILIAAGLGIIGAWYGAGVMFYILSNIAYLMGSFAAIIVFGSVIRALIAGWHGAGATMQEAIALEEAEKAKVFEYKKTTIMGAYELLNEIILKIYNNNPKAENAEIAESVIDFLKKEKALAEKLFGFKRGSLYDYYIKLFGSYTKLKDYIENKIKEFRQYKT